MSTNESHHEEHADGIVEDREKTPPVYFTVLFYGLIIWGVAFMAFYLLSGWSSDAEFQDKMAAHKGEAPTQQQAAAAPSAPSAPSSPAAPTPPATAPAAAAESVAEGQALFAKHCAGCHGAEGKGAFGPDLSGDYKYGKTSLAVQESISLGRPKNMPAFENKLSSEEIEAVTGFILGL
jgi:cytochrome c oxidase cbb3-type subunit 3